MECKFKMPDTITIIEPCFIERLLSIVGMHVVVETSRNTQSGKLLEVEQDHIVLKNGSSVTFIRWQQIISVMPIERC